MDASLVKSQETLTKQMAILERQITNRHEEQRMVGDSSQNLQRTISQLVELQKLRMQKDISLSEPEQNNLTASLNRFLGSQKRYQDLNASLSALMGDLDSDLPHACSLLSWPS